MSDEPKHQTSRAGAFFVLIAVGGSAISVVSWHVFSNRTAELDTSGFDMSTAPDTVRPPVRSTPSASTPAAPNSLGMVKGDKGMQVVGPGASTPKTKGSSGAAANPTDPKEAAALNFRDAAIKNEKSVAAFVRRMQKKHPSIARYGKDWAASPELRALRDQYWKNKDPLKFAYGLAKSGDFKKLVKKYATDPGIRDVLMTGLREAPPDLTGAASGVFQNDKVTKNLVTTVIEATGLPPSLTGFLTGENKAATKDQMMSDIMNSADMKKAMQNKPAAVKLEEETAEKVQQAAPNGFTPLGGR